MSVVLVVTAVDAERDAVVRGLSGTSREVRLGPLAGVVVQAPSAEIHVVATGVGPAAAAASTTAALCSGPAYDLVMSAGVGGGLPGRAAIGDLVWATASVAADLGALTDEGFATLSDLNLHGGEPVVHTEADAVRLLTGGALPVVTGTVISVSCMTGTDARAAELAARYPDAVAEAMEGYGVATAAALFAPVRRIATAEIRAICNAVGRRDPARWELPRALDTLAQAFAVLTTSAAPATHRNPA